MLSAYNSHHNHSTITNHKTLSIAIQEEIKKDKEELGFKKTKDTEGESTLEKNTANIDANKYDVEFDVDPLFQKTSAKFDEGGARGLLLNNLTVSSVILEEIHCM